MCKKPCQLIILVGLAWLLPVSDVSTSPANKVLSHF
jgi:hypothetical protein